MNLTLRRKDFTIDGIFGVLENESGQIIAATLEHAYPYDCFGGLFKSKIPNGIYICQRGMHTLERIKEPFETFEITGVVGHTHILFHVGNTNMDSEGCVLLGTEKWNEMVIKSRDAFNKFMQLQTDVNIFSLVVK